MRFSFASDSSKGTPSPERITQLLEAVAEQAFPGCETTGVPVADGGERTIDVMILTLNGTYRGLTVHESLMEEAQSFHGEFGGDSVIIEMTAASGLPMVPANGRNPLNTATYGTEELIKNTLDRGHRKISIAIRDSATNGGGTRAMRALDVGFLDDQGNELGGRGRDLTRVADIDMSRIHPAVSQSRFAAMYDVTNPLTGSDGVTYTFEKQKDDTPEILDVLGGGVIRCAALLKEKLSMDVNKVPGAGAAGGLGATLCVFLRTNFRSGTDTVLDLVYFDSLLEGVDLVITGEGRTDWQSAFGKVSSRAGGRCRERDIPVAVIVGGMGDKVETIFDYSIDSIITTINGAVDIEEALKRAEELYTSVTDCTFRVPRAGVSLGRK